jgi:hypothetical protein
MKPQRFEIGQAVTPRDTNWKNPNNYPTPKFGEVYHVQYYSHEGCDCGECGRMPYVWLREFHYGVCQSKLEPVISDSELETLLNSVPETIETI